MSAKIRSWVALEGIEHAVAMMRVDVHVGHALDAVTPTQRLDQHADIVEHAESRGGVAARVMQPGDRHEHAPAPAIENIFESVQHRADDDRARLKHARERRRVAGIEITLAALRLPAHARDVIGGMKQREIVLGAGNRCADFRLPVESLAQGLLPESGLAVGAEGMPMVRNRRPPTPRRDRARTRISGSQEECAGSI